LKEVKKTISVLKEDKEHLKDRIYSRDLIIDQQNRELRSLNSRLTEIQHLHKTIIRRKAIERFIKTLMNLFSKYMPIPYRGSNHNPPSDQEWKEASDGQRLNYWEKLPAIY